MTVGAASNAGPEREVPADRSTAAAVLASFELAIKQ